MRKFACPIGVPVAVVGRGEDGDDVAVVAPVVALHDELMRARHQREPVAVVERLRDVLPEGVARATWRYSPSASANYISHISIVLVFLGLVRT